MYNTGVKHKNGWGSFLDEARRMLAEAEQPKRRKELRQAIRGFEILIARGAALPEQLENQKANAATHC
jgi:hypothetical protein